MHYEIKSALCLLALVVAVTGILPAHASKNVPPTVAAGTCTALKKTDYAVSTTPESTTSSSYINLDDGGRIAFNSAKAGCIITTFSAVVVVSANAWLYVHILLDDATVCPPDDNYFATSTVAGESMVAAHAMTFVCGDVPAGSHTIQVQYHDMYSDGPVTLFNRTLTVSHR